MSYSGSTLFAGISQWTQLPLDQLNFLVTQFVCLGAAFVFRRLLHPTKASPTLRLSVALSLGLVLSYFCFGRDVLHLIGLPSCCFFAIHLLPIGISHIICLVISLVYLSSIHLWRQWTDYGAYVIDITGPLMIMTQKVTSLAFSLHDGLAKSWDSLNSSQKRYAIKKKPGVLEFFGYVLNFQGVCAGPMVFYADYQDFINGRNFKARDAHGQLVVGVGDGTNGTTTTTTVSSKPISTHRYVPVLDERGEPSSMTEVTGKVSTSIMFGLGFLVLAPVFDIRHLKEDGFLNASLLYRWLYVIAATTVARWKYYLAWILADAISNASGLGFAGYAADTGLPRWDLISNVDVRGVEVGLSFRELIASWNKGTNTWLRMCVYERVPKFRTLSTYVLSAFWHGFYPGYYLTFIGGALFTLSSRAARRSIRPLFLSSKRRKFFYDCLTTVSSRFILAYITFPFVLLEFQPSIAVYKTFYFVPHVMGVLFFALLPYVLPPSRRDEKAATSA